uniref:Uncharacterized protein n=1 Tax=Hyaloperonospora arabidopsidis (strain Emoy2) TaxID=559515 RepID=M4C515_HYAAE
MLYMNLTRSSACLVRDTPLLICVFSSGIYTWVRSTSGDPHLGLSSNTSSAASADTLGAPATVVDPVGDPSATPTGAADISPASDDSVGDTSTHLAGAPDAAPVPGDLVDDVFTHPAESLGILLQKYSKKVELVELFANRQ